ncbi:MAG: hypothetical protein QOJ69_601 [Actinomycetota bacterium]|nr:hypothetical protein [Actinomycetota bacterium]
MVDRADERRHPPGAAAGWEESYSFDFADADGSLGGYVRLAVRPGDGRLSGDGRAWYWAAVVERGSPAVLVRDHDVDLPPERSLEVRASGLWADMTCETPLEHWTVGLEAFGVALDDPAEAFGAERGDPRALGLDLEWEATGVADPAWARSPGYAQPCVVHGEVLVGSRRIDFSGVGWRSHEWGVREWWSGPSTWLTGHLDDGTPFAGESLDAVVGDDGLARTASLTVGHLELRAGPLAHAPVAVAGRDGRFSWLDRALCRYETDDGRTGVGWSDWLRPA